ncbi:MAG: hypothetical protein J2P27_07850 [Actinobacteria bacterium]|nr:hypothetical protein [Actinomycetota bacterium]
MKQDNQASRDRDLYESRAAELVGRRVLEVAYWDVHNFADEPRAWDYGDWHHAVMGVDLITDGGPSCVLWTDTFFPYGVEVFPAAQVADHILVGDDGSQSWSVSRSDCWRGRLGSPMQSVQTFWEHVTIGPGYVGNTQVADAYEVDVPVAMRIDFPAGPVWMVAGIPQEAQMREVFVPGDEILIVFSADRMRQIGFPDSEFLATSDP